ncbi:MAG: hypothetical protein ACE5F1_18395, partial [Planctomycetota bacterium]
MEWALGSVTRTVLLIGLFTLEAQAQNAEAHRRVRREVLAISDTVVKDRGSPSVDIVRSAYETPLNYLGIIVRQHSLKDGP